MPSATDWIRLLDLKPHPEGGWFREVYRSPETIPASALPARYGAARAIATSIIYLLTAGEFSAFHRLRCDEIWCHHTGSGLTLQMIAADGTLTQAGLGPDPTRGHLPQRVVPAGSWFAVTLDDPTSFGLAGCVTAPGFAFDDFELGLRSTLLEAYPAHAEIIRRLTRGGDGQRPAGMAP